MRQYSYTSDVIISLVLWSVKTLILLLVFWWVGKWATGGTDPIVTMTLGSMLTSSIGCIFGSILDAIIGEFVLAPYFLKWFFIVLFFWIGMIGLATMGYYSLLISIPLGLFVLVLIVRMTFKD